MSQEADGSHRREQPPVSRERLQAKLREARIAWAVTWVLPLLPWSVHLSSWASSGEFTSDIRMSLLYLVPITLLPFVMWIPCNRAANRLRVFDENAEPGDETGDQRPS